MLQYLSESASRHEAGPSVPTPWCALHIPVFFSLSLFMGRFWKRKQIVLKWEQMGSAYYPKSFYDRIKTSKAHVWQPAVQDTKQTPLTSNIFLLKRLKLAPLSCTSAELLLVCNSKSKERNHPLCATNTAETQTLAPGRKLKRKPSS